MDVDPLEPIQFECAREAPAHSFVRLESVDLSAGCDLCREDSRECAQVRADVDSDHSGRQVVSANRELVTFEVTAGPQERRHLFRFELERETPCVPQHTWTRSTCSQTQPRFG